MKVIFNLIIIKLAPMKHFPITDYCVTNCSDISLKSNSLFKRSLFHILVYYMKISNRSFSLRGNLVCILTIKPSDPTVTGVVVISVMGLCKKDMVKISVCLGTVQTTLHTLL